MPLAIGLFSLALGIGLMVWHWRQWSQLLLHQPEPRELRYGANQFRRRAMIGSLMAITGAILMSFRWANDPRIVTLSILLLFLLLACILVLAVLDLLNVIVHLRVGPVARAARNRLLDEYKRRMEEKTRDGPEAPASDE
jgi:hypothetical protein